MEMRARAAPRASSKAYRLTGLDHLIWLHKALVKVAIDSLKLIRMTNYDVVAVSASLIARQAHLAVVSSIYGIVAPDSEVNAFMHTPEFGPVTVVGCNAHV